MSPTDHLVRSNQAPGPVVSSDDVAEPGQMFSDLDVINYLRTFFYITSTDGFAFYEDLAETVFRTVCFRDSGCKASMKPSLDDTTMMFGAVASHRYFSQPLLTDIALRGSFMGDSARQILEAGKYELRMGNYAFVQPGNGRAADRDAYMAYWCRAPQRRLLTNATYPFISALHYSVYMKGFGFGEAIGYESYVRDPWDTSKLLRSSRSVKNS